MKTNEERTVVTAERDTEIGRSVYVKLQRICDHLQRRDELDAKTAADYLLCGALFVAADRYDIALTDTKAVVDVLIESVLHDSLPPETRH